MSRSNNTDIKNPTTKVYTWSGEKGKFISYDKETKTKVEVELPFRFVVLDALSCIRGYNKKEEAGYYSNEVRDLKKEVLHVRTKKGLFLEGLYADIKDHVPGGKYTQSVYGIVKEGENNVIVNIQLSGSALGAWIEFRKKNSIFEGAITVKESIEKKNGATTYREPVYAPIPISPETEKAALEMDKELQKYVKAMLARNGESLPGEQTAEEVSAVEETASLPAADDKDDLPF